MQEHAFSLEERYIEVRRDAFADRLKMSAAHALGVFEEEIDFCNALKEEGWIEVKLPAFGGIEGEEFTVERFTGREYLQWYGTEAHREVFADDFWIDLVVPQQGFERASVDVLVITDVRFPNEARRIKDVGGSVWHIVRADQDEGDAHASEQVLPVELIDKRIHNDGTLEEFKIEVVNEFVKWIKP